MKLLPNLSMERALWHKHPGVNTDGLSLGERAADHLKAGFGSWAFLGLLNGFILLWVGVNIILGNPFDPYPFILLNLGLSWLAAQQGGALQIASNRGDRIASELALDTHKNTAEIVEINRKQLEILEALQALNKTMNNGVQCKKCRAAK